jgi:hypothetical protein
MSPADDPRERFKRPLERPGANLPVPARPQPTPEPVKEEAGGGGLARLLNAVAKMLQPKPADQAPAQPTRDPASEPALYTVLVAAMNGDNADGAASLALYKILDAHPTLKVKPLPRPFQLDNLEDLAQATALQTNARHAIADENADLLVWGDVGKDGYRLRLTTINPPDEERAGTFGLSTRIELPLALSDIQSALLQAACLAAGEAQTEVQRAAVRRLLPAAASPLEAAVAKPPVSWSMGQQRSLLFVYGHVCAVCGQVVAPSQAGEWFQKAVSAYKAAEKRLGRTDPAWESALIHKALAAALTVWAERSKDQARDLLEQAVPQWRMAGEGLNRATMPQEWAAAQTRLGVALYRLDLLTGDTELLRESIQVLQAALQVHTKAEYPQRWADLMNVIAQVLEVYGDQLKNPAVLQRAIDACHLVLEVRTRERTPLAWAATRNTLGSTLFLMDRHGGGIDHLTDAEQVLSEALEVFTLHGAKGPAQVAARNLAHVRKLAEERRGRAVIDPGWN